MLKSNKKADILRNDGNEFFEEGDFCEALLAYNFSLCYARTGTETVGLAYGNRSAVYFHLEEYELCIQNIELAKAHNYPLNKIQKLDTREEEAKRLMNENPSKPEGEQAKFFKVSYPPHPKHPNLADCLELYEDKKLGPHIITTRDLKPGDNVALTDPAFTLITKRARLHHCTNCKKNSMRLSLVPCPGCIYGEKILDLSFSSILMTNL
jgi:hypothetical protein